MKKIFVLILFCCYPLMSQNDFEMKIKLTNSDGKTFERSTFGINANATNYIDAELGEFDFPSLFPSILGSAFSFYEPKYEEYILSYKDLRPDFNSERDSIVFLFEVTGIINEYKLDWSSFPIGIKSAELKSKFLSDKYNSIDMINQKSLEVKNSAVNEFYIVLKNYNDNVLVNEGIEIITKLFPIPASNSIQINSSKKYTSVVIYDNIGQKTMLPVEGNIINTSEILPGVYQIVLIDENNNKEKNKIIIN